MWKYASWALPCFCFIAMNAGAAGLPTDLDAVPRSAPVFAHIRAEDLWKNEALKDVRLLFEKAGDKRVKQLIESFVPDLSTIDRMTIVMMSPMDPERMFPRNNPEGKSALFVVHTKKPFDRTEIRKAYADHEKFYQRKMYYFIEEIWAGLIFLDDQTLILGSEDSLIEWISARASDKNDGPLQEVLEKTAKGPMFTLGMHPPALFRDEMKRGLPPPMLTLCDARSLCFTANLNKAVSLDLAIKFNKEDQAKEGEKALRDLFDLARQGLKEPMGELEKMLDKGSADKPRKLSEIVEASSMVAALGFLNIIDESLKNQKIERMQTSVVTKLHVDHAQAHLVPAALMAITAFGTSAEARFNQVAGVIGGQNPPADPIADHLKTLAEALEKYRKDKGTYPPPALCDQHGRAVLSWRVALLPYMGQEDLYREFRLDEPWDSLHNKLLIKKIPAALKFPTGRDGGFEQDWSYADWRYPLVGRTRDLAVTGPGTIFDAKAGLKKDDIDPKTILLVLAGSGQTVYWTKPADIEFNPKQKAEEMFKVRRKPNPVCPTRIILADGTVEAVESIDKIEWDKRIPAKKNK